MPDVRESGLGKFVRATTIRTHTWWLSGTPYTQRHYSADGSIWETHNRPNRRDRTIIAQGKPRRVQSITRA